MPWLQNAKMVENPFVMAPRAVERVSLFLSAALKYKISREPFSDPQTETDSRSKHPKLALAPPQFWA